jgi:hypothetical protein
MRRLVLVCALAAGAAPALAQGPVPGQQCILDFFPRDPSRPPATNAVRVGNTDTYDVFVGGGALYRCRGQDVTLTADSTEYYGSRGVLYLIGTVRYREPRANVDADRATYFQADERLLAEGRVVATLPSGSTMRGPRVEYFRAVPRVRAQTRMVATGRPTMRLIQQDSTGRPQEPVDIVADRVVTEADSLVYAGGNVDVTRTDFLAKGDSAFLDSGREYVQLMRDPSIESRQGRPFSLTGTVLDLHSQQRQLRQVVAKGEGRAVSQDLVLTSDTIDLRVSENRLQHAYAWGPGRARATSPGRDIVADSLEIIMPAQRMREVRAVGGALAQTDPDSVRIATKERDWLSGDTIVALFDTAAAAPTAGTPRPAQRASRDTTERPRIRELVALGSARSYYQIPSQDGGPTRPAINYVRGRQITVNFLPALDTTRAQQQVDRVTVLDSAAGVYLEPSRDTAAARARQDTAGGVRPDTTRAARPATPPGAPGSSATPTRRPPATRPPARRPRTLE